MAKTAQGNGRRPPSASGRYRPPQRHGQPIWIIPVVLGAIIVIILAAAARRNADPDQATAAQTAAVVSAVTSVPQAAWDAAGTSGLTQGTASAPSASLPTAIPAAQQPAGVPTVLYMGAEFCPYCAAERWVLVSTLSRFGSFSGLTLITSSSTDIYPNTPTFAFAKAKYTSSSITLQTVETEDRNEQPLQTPTATQESLIDEFDTGGDIPFILIGGKYVWTAGSQYSPGLLSGLDWSKVAAQMAAGSSSLATTILSNGNVISAAICSVDGNQPASVCTSAGVQAAAAVLPKVS